MQFFEVFDEITVSQPEMRDIVLKVLENKGLAVIVSGAIGEQIKITALKELQ